MANNPWNLHAKGRLLKYQGPIYSAEGLKPKLQLSLHLAHWGGSDRNCPTEKRFSNIYFNGFLFPLHLKRIPAGAEQTMHDYIHDVYSRYREWMKTTDKALAVTFERAKAIEKLKIDLAQKDRII